VRCKCSFYCCSTCVVNAAFIVVAQALSMQLSLLYTSRYIWPPRLGSRRPPVLVVNNCYWQQKHACLHGFGDLLSIRATLNMSQYTPLVAHTPVPSKTFLFLTVALASSAAAMALASRLLLQVSQRLLLATVYQCIPIGAVPRSLSII
jgi:hypothetical protein